MTPRRLMLGALAALGFVLWAASPAAAHASLQATTPGDGTVLAHAPRVVTATYDESVGVSADSLRVYAPDGTRVDSGPTRHGGSARRIAVDLHGDLSDGTYTVAWHVVSADSHPVQGAFTFSVGHPSSHVGAASVESSGSTAASVTYAVVRGIAFAAYAVLFGGLVFLASCWPAGGDDVRSRRVLWVGWTASALAAVGTFLLQGVYAAGVGLGHLLDGTLVADTAHSRIGVAVGCRLVALGAAAALVVAARGLSEAGRSRRGFAAGCVLLTVAAAFTWSLTDHASVGAEQPLPLVADVLHLAAMACWAGGLTLLLAAALREPHADSAARALRVFSPLAGWSVVLILVTGTYQSWRNIGHWGALFHTTYGVLVLVKIAGLAVLVVLGYQARRILGHTPVRGRSRPGHPSGPIDLVALRRSVALETAVVLGVLAATAVLVDTATGRESYHPTYAAHRTFDTGTRAGQVNVTVTPARLGPQTVTIRLADHAGHPYRPAQVSAAFSLTSQSLGPLDLRVRTVSKGVYRSTPEPLTVAGTWTLSVLVRSDRFDETTVLFRVPIS